MLVESSSSSHPWQARMPLWGIDERLAHSSFLEDTGRALGLWPRLARIRQLPGITPPGWNDVGRPRPYQSRLRSFETTRWLHSVNACALMRLASSVLRLDFVTSQMAELLALSHDGAMPAGGDQVKALCEARGLNPLSWDEDARFSELFQTSEWEACRAQYALDRRVVGRLVAALHGDGYVGELLNFADTGSYLGLDVPVWLESVDDSSTREVHAIAQRLSRSGLWENLSLCDGHVVVRDVGALHDLLWLRALMWRHVYCSWRTKYLEARFVEVFAPYLLGAGHITLRDLMSRDDAWLDKVLMEIFGRGAQTFSLTPVTAWVFSSASAACAYEAEQARDGCFTVLHRFCRTSVSTKTGAYYVPVSDGRAQTFAVAYPKESQALQAFMEPLCRPEWVVYSTAEPPSFSQSLVAAWRQARVRWHLSSLV